MNHAPEFNPKDKYRCIACDSDFKQPEGTDYIRNSGYVMLFLAILVSLVTYFLLNNQIKDYNVYVSIYNKYGDKTDHEILSITNGPNSLHGLEFILKQKCDKEGPPIPVNETPYDIVFVISLFMGMWAAIMLIIAATRPPRCPNCKSFNYIKN